MRKLSLVNDQDLIVVGRVRPDGSEMLFVYVHMMAIMVASRLELGEFDFLHYSEVFSVASQ